MWRAALVIGLALIGLATPAPGITPAWYSGSSTFSGIATFYGEGGHAGGHCVLRNPVPEMYHNMTAVAINGPMYDGSVTCGMCLEVRGPGAGIGTTPVKGAFMAYVADQCPECHRGDLDLAMNGDGRWDIEWNAVPCSDGPVSFYFEGSNPYYLKMQPRGMKSPATKVTVGGRVGTRTADNFFEMRPGSGSFKFPMPVTVETVLGCTYSTSLEGYSGTQKPAGLKNYNCDGVEAGSTGAPRPSPVPGPSPNVAPSPSEQRSPSLSQPAAPQAPSAPKERTSPDSDKTKACAALWEQCGGIGHTGPTCCSAGECIYSNDWYSQCLKPASSNPATLAPASPSPRATDPMQMGTCSAMWGQCGGNGYPGPTCCSEGNCKFVNDWYSQCL